jgi:signal-transduction protein with cAMP-binding, CBS, and nucleotidyltransferase domain
MRTPAVTCTTATRLRDLARIMRDRNVGSVLVMDEVGYLAGIVTDRDLAVRGFAEGRSPDVTVDEVMTRDLATVSIHADIADAGAIMSKRDVRRLPVVDEQDQPHGVISLDDLVRQVGRETNTLVDTILQQTSHLAAW